MKIAVLEHFTSLPRGAVATGPVSEGRAIRDAAVADLSRLPGAALIVVGRRADFGAALRRADAALVIAPEAGRVLERLCRLVERRGKLLLGPSSAAVRLMGDKLETAEVLAASGVPTPAVRAIPIRSARRWLREVKPPFVVKPRDGYGSVGVRLVRRPREIDAAVRAVSGATSRADCLVQEYVPGLAASVSIFASTNRLDLGLNRQRLRRGPGFAYAGGETFWPHALADEAIDAARAAVEALSRSCGGARGYVGVDLVIGRSGVRVIEVNPRLTASYVGLRRSIEGNLAELMVRAAEGRVLPERVTPSGRCRFEADGTTRILSPVEATRHRKRAIAGRLRPGVCPRNRMGRAHGAAIPMCPRGSWRRGAVRVVAAPPR